VQYKESLEVLFNLNYRGISYSWRWTWSSIIPSI